MCFLSSVLSLLISCYLSFCNHLSMFPDPLLTVFSFSSLLPSFVPVFTHNPLFFFVLLPLHLPLFFLHRPTYSSRNLFFYCISIISFLSMYSLVPSSVFSSLSAALAFASASYAAYKSPFTTVSHCSLLPLSKLCERTAEKELGTL